MTGTAAALVAAHLHVVALEVVAAGASPQSPTAVHRQVPAGSGPVTVTAAPPTAAPPSAAPVPVPSPVPTAVPRPPTSRPAAQRPAAVSTGYPAVSVQPAPDVSEVARLVNQDRAAAGLPPLVVSAALQRAAAHHAAQNAAIDRMSHDGAVQDVNAEGVRYTTLGECLGWVSGSPDASFINTLWMQSAEHRPIILGNFTAMGAGWARSASGKWYLSLVETN